MAAIRDRTWYLWRVDYPVGSGLRALSRYAASTILASGMALFAVQAVPDLVSDWKVRGEARYIREAKMVEGNCKVRLAVHFCNVKIELPTPFGTLRREQTYIFAGYFLEPQNYAVHTLVNPLHLDLITTDLGLSKLVNRTVTFLSCFVVAAAVIWLLLSRLGSKSGRCVSRP